MGHVGQPTAHAFSLQVARDSNYIEKARKTCQVTTGQPDDRLSCACLRWTHFRLPNLDNSTAQPRALLRLRAAISVITQATLDLNRADCQNGTSTGQDLSSDVLGFSVTQTGAENTRSQAF